jgi:hypothetical protein
LLLLIELPSESCRLESDTTIELSKCTKVQQLSTKSEAYAVLTLVIASKEPKYVTTAFTTSLMSELNQHHPSLTGHQSTLP